MSDLSNYNNLYADLAQSTYLDRTVQFPYNPKTWNLQQREAHQKGESVPFDFSRNVTDTQGDVTTAGGSGLPNGGRVFLQPDLKVKAADGSSENVMEDDETGYQSYLVTDKAKLSDSSHAYLAIRGSDNYKNPHDLWTDWVMNDGVFAFGNTGIAQSKDAELALKTSISKLPKNVKLDVTGHSLGDDGVRAGYG